jgi:PAS domain S-box-containing protein
MIDFFDVRTLTAVMGSIMLVSAAAMACYLFNRRTYGNFKLWTLGMGSLSFGFLLISFRGLVPDMVSIVLANALIFFSFALIYLGFKVLGQSPAPMKRHLGGMAFLSFAVFPFFTYVVPSLSLRIGLISLTGALYFGLCARMLESGIKGIRIRDNILLGSALVLMAATLAVRGVYFLVPGSVPAGFMETGPFQGMVLFIITLVQVAFVMGLMQLNSQLLEQDLSEKEKHLEKNQAWYRQLVEESSQGLEILKEAEALNTAMFRIASAVNTTKNLKDLFASIHTSLSVVIDVTNFFIALKDPRTLTLDFPYHVDTTDDDFSSIPFEDAENSLTGLVFSKGKPLLLNREELEARAAQNKIWGPLPLIWMGVPLMVKKDVIGAVAVQSYTDPDLYSSRDLEILTAVSHQMALAIERRQAQDALMESEQRYRHLFAHAPAGICEVDFENNRFIRVNEIICRVSGYTREQLMAMHPFDLLTRESRERLADRLARLSAGHRETRNIEYEMITKKNRRMSIAMTLDFEDEDRRLGRTMVVVHDITWRKQLEKEKIDAQKLVAEQQKLALIGQVAGKMAHDFNNILAVIMGNIELLLMDYTDPGLVKKLKMMLSQTEKGQLLTRNLVAFAKTREPRQKYFSLNEKIDLSLALMKKDLEGIRVNRSYADDLPEILADQGMIEHALINLFQNSIHALSKTADPKITFTTFLRDSTICLEVTDNGCGIPEQHLADIFTPSFTLKGGRDLTGAYAPGIKGTGYGLSNIQKYVNQHKGSIAVSSEPGQGTCVTVCFPVIEKQLTVAEKQFLASAMVRPGMRILLVEDEPDISYVQHRILSQEPCSHQVDAAVDGRTAMDLFDSHTYDLVSLDYMLQGSLNGMDVYRHIRKTNTAIPVLFVSGNIEFIEEIKSLKENDRQVAHLSKPCRGSEYIEAVDSLLTRG